MIVYRDGGEEAEPGPLLAACLAGARALAGPTRATTDDATELLIELGALEAAVVDALFPDADGLMPLATRLRAASLAAGRLFRAATRGEPTAAVAHAVAAALEGAGPLPARVRVKVAEGYAYYALYPETYLAAAERFAAAVRPDRAVCLGIRSIGTSLSAVVAAALAAGGCTVESHTLRPHGHPFARRPVLDPALAAALGEARDAWFLIVDEGPGLSGSSLGGTAWLLSDLGVADERIVLCPSHLPDPAGFLSPAARARWTRHPKLHAPFETAWLPQAPFPAAAEDLSGGAWRGRLGLPEAEWPAVEPRHERRKYLAPAPDGGLVLHRFAGLGRYGRQARRRAEALAAAGFVAPVVDLRQGFLAQRFLPGRPGTAGDADFAFLATAARYLAHLAQRHAQPEPARPEALLPMIRTNVAEGLGPATEVRIERHVRALGEVPAVAIDGRMLAHEWLLTPDGWLKTDAIDHHAGHFLPGCADIAWDVAGLGVELDLPPGVQAELAQAVGEATGDRCLHTRLPFYRTAYLAFRLGYASLAAGSLRGTADGLRMERLAERYRQALATSLDAL